METLPDFIAALRTGVWRAVENCAENRIRNAFHLPSVADNHGLVFWIVISIETTRRADLFQNRPALKIESRIGFGVIAGQEPDTTSSSSLSLSSHALLIGGWLSCSLGRGLALGRQSEESEILNS